MNPQRIRVPIGFAYVALFLYFAWPTPLYFAVGTLVACLGLALRVWAAGHMEKFVSLAVTGPYRYTRNPLYLGSFVMGLGFSLTGGRAWLTLLFLALYLLLYVPVMRREEKELADSYGLEYKRYRERVSLFVPSAGGPRPQGEKRRFAWQRVRRNREYNAVLGFLLLTAVVYIKLVYLKG